MTARFQTSRKLRLESLEVRTLLDAAGVTIITHGAQVISGLPDWEVTLGQAILDRADGAATDRTTGSIFQHDQTTGQWTPLGGGVWNNSNSADEHIVLLYNWSNESGNLADGWSDAAADNLFASLLDDNDYLLGDISGRSFYELTLEEPALEEGGIVDFHFIGHSRGAVVNSLVTERFDAYFDTMIDHVTSLDGHPASAMNDRGYDPNNPNENSRIFTYDNVVFADNYYQQDGAYEPLLFDFNGVQANGAYNFRIPTPVIENGGSSLEHSDVHTWYYGTVTEAFAGDYSGFSGAGRNNDGDVSFPESWWGNSGVPDRDATGFHFTQIAGGSREGLPEFRTKIDSGVIETVNNGDFRHGDGFFSDSPPGWLNHGGGGSGPLGGGQSYLELNSGGNDFFRRHNPLWFDVNTVSVEYDYWINNSSGNDQLEVLVGNTVIDTISLSSTTSDFVLNRQANLGFAHGGFVDTLTFQINDTASNGIDSAVRIDNIRLIIDVPNSEADFDDSGTVAGSDFLAWQRDAGKPLGATNSQGDADFDGNVDLDDLNLWQQQYGTTPTNAASGFAERSTDSPTEPLLSGNTWIDRFGLELPWKREKTLFPRLRGFFHFFS
ncbi:MAG: hypothetical protein RH917_10870 [Lacipirellulaceae bacterium]